MKKILLFFGFFLLIQINIYSQDINKYETPLVVNVGMGNNNLLEIDGCNLISNNVNWNKIGIYTATYYNENKQNYFSRVVIVTNFEELDNAIGIYESNFYDLNESYHIYDCIIYDENSFFVFGAIENDDQKQSNFPQEHAFISFYQNGELQWQKIYYDINSYISSCIKTNIGVAYLLTYEYGSQSEMKLIELNIHGNQIRELQITTNGMEYGYNLFNNENFIYVVCLSDSTNGDIEYQYDNTLYLAILKIRYDTFTIEDYRCYGNGGYNSIKKVIFADGIIYLLFQATGTFGSYQNDEGGYRGNFLVKLNQDFSSESIYYVNVNEYIKDFFITNHEITFVSHDSKNDQSFLKFIVYNLNLQLKKEYYWYYPYDGNIRDVNSIRNYLGEVILSIEVIDEKGVAFKGLLTIDNYKHYGFAKYVDNPFNVVAILFAEENIYIFGRSNDGLYLVNGMVIETCITSSYEAIYRNYNVRRVKINNFYLEVIGNSKDKDCFGHHEELYKIDFTNITLYLLDEYYVYEKINICDGQTYDTGIEICFNGDGYLNDKKILSPLLINKPGEYCLIVYGNSGERKVLNFNVKKLSLVPNPIDKIDINIESIEIENSNKSIENKLISSAIITNSRNYNHEIVLFIIINSFFLILALLIRRRKCVK